MMRLTSKSDRTAQYFLCQYVRDPFRREPRNVGVIVRREGEYAMRFYGESTPGGKIDRRRLAAFGDPDNYQNWVHFWKRKLAKSPENILQELSTSSSRNYHVIDGGHVAHPGADPIDEVASHLFHLLVLEDAFDDAVGLPEEDRKSSPELVREVASAFRKLDLFHGSQFTSRMYRERDLIGKTRPHRFEFLQVNGESVPIEVFDFRRSRPKTLERHVGWACFAFEDVRNGPMKVSRPKSIIQHGSGESPTLKASSLQVELDTLASVSDLVDWSSEHERRAFLEERRQAALHS